MSWKTDSSIIHRQAAEIFDKEIQDGDGYHNTCHGANQNREIHYRVIGNRIKQYHP
jgi:hypothetical protein